ncbi:MAG TPA: Si-specific NAD(P)(+) transhydrogenase [Kofleriaceae bacterium]|nr:Si-specific NAD(P)(+) transhydrogenase [Kofleriaceae bacterium]
MSGDFDLIVIGSGPAGEKAAVKAAYFDKKVAVIERFPALGGECRKAGLPSKVLREAALSYSGARRRLGDLFRTEPGAPMRMEHFLRACDPLCDRHGDRVADNLARHGVDCITGAARFIDAGRIAVERDGQVRELTASVFLIATGSRPVRPDFIPFGQPGVHCSDTILGMERLPRSLAVVGAGVIGTEYASIFQALGVDVHLIDGRPRVLGFVDGEIHDHLLAELRGRGMHTHLDQEVTGCRVARAGEVEVTTSAGTVVRTEALLFSGGRQANTEELGLERIGVQLGRMGRPVVDEVFRTSVPTIYAAGDVIGFPSLASASMEQGRVAVAAAFRFEEEQRDRADLVPLEGTIPYPLLPYGIYTIPSVSMVGQTEEQVAASGQAYLVGRASYAAQDRGPLVGDTGGLLKLVCDRASRRILGVHIVGETAEELIHLGQACMHFGGTLEYFVRTVFNFPTLATLYKQAAYDVLTSLGPQRDKLTYGQASR